MLTSLHQPRFRGIYPLKDVPPKEVERVKKRLDENKTYYRHLQVPDLETGDGFVRYLTVNDSLGNHTTKQFWLTVKKVPPDAPATEKQAFANIVKRFNELIQPFVKSFEQIYAANGILKPAKPVSASTETPKQTTNLPKLSTLPTQKPPSTPKPLKDIKQAMTKLGSFGEGETFFQKLHDHLYARLSHFSSQQLAREYELLTQAALKKDDSLALAVFKNIFQDASASYGYIDSAGFTESSQQKGRLFLNYRNDQEKLYRASQKVIPLLLPTGVLAPYQQGKLHTIHPKAGQFPYLELLQDQLDQPSKEV